MKSVLAFCILLTIGTQVPSGGAPAAPFTLKVEAQSPSVVAGGKIVLEIALRNVSQGDLVVRQTMRPDQGEWDYGVDVRDEKGDRVDQTKYGRNREQIIRLLSSHMHTLKPDQTLNAEITLSKLFDLTVPGRYTIQVSRHVDDHESEPLVRSDTTTITVTAF